MSNMSYCRFQNTVADLSDCLEAQEGLAALANDSGSDDFDDQAQARQTGYDALSSAERAAYLDLLATARQLLDNADDDHLAAAGVSR